MTSARSDEPLELTLDRDADVPIGVQLAWALRARIRSGALAPGARLPALHRLAQDLGVNPNTVRAVYGRLEQDELVATRHGSGTFVTGAGGGEPAPALAQLVSGAARAARDAGVDPRELAAALYVGGEQPAAPRGTRAEADERRALRAQIAALERALSDLLARRPHLAPPAALDEPVRAPQARLLGAAELEAQRDALLAQLVELQAAINPAAPDDPPDDAATPRTTPEERRSSARTAGAKQPRRASSRSVAKLRPAPRTT